AATGWVEAQKGIVLSPRAGTVDAALLGARATGFSGRGDLARVTFRALHDGDPAVRFARVAARDAANRPLAPGSLVYDAREPAPARTLLLAPAPNPAPATAALEFALAEPGRLEFAIYSVDGRRVRTLADGAFAPGTYHFTWAGDDDARRPVAPG